MRYGIEIVPFGEFSDPRLIAKFAQIAEGAGWEALWLWDHVGFPYGVADLWISLAAVAQVTERMKLVSGVAVLPRYQPQVLWRITTSLDLLSGGRLVLGAGSGAVAEEFEAHGETYDPKIQATRLEESLELVRRMWSGETVSYRGEHYTAEGMTYQPQPIQKPHPPVWIGGESNPAKRRAARWDGWIIGTVDEHSQITRSPEMIAADIAYIQQHRSSHLPLEVAIDGITSGPQDLSLLSEYEAAGATWYFEILFGMRASMQELLERVEAGPPELEKYVFHVG